MVRSTKPRLCSVDCTMRGECSLVGKDRHGVRRRAAVGLHDCGVGVDDVMRDGVLGKADARCVRTRTNAAEFDAWYGVKSAPGTGHV